MRGEEHAWRFRKDGQHRLDGTRSKDRAGNRRRFANDGGRRSTVAFQRERQALTGSPQLQAAKPRGLGPRHQLPDFVEFHRFAPSVSTNRQAVEFDQAAHSSEVVLHLVQPREGFVVGGLQKAELHPRARLPQSPRCPLR